MRNQQIRDAIREAGIYQWELADALNIAEHTLVRWLRHELDVDTHNRIMRAIDEAKNLKEENQLIERRQTK